MAVRSKEKEKQQKHLCSIPVQLAERNMITLDTLQSRCEILQTDESNCEDGEKEGIVIIKMEWYSINNYIQTISDVSSLLSTESKVWKSVHNKSKNAKKRKLHHITGDAVTTTTTTTTTAGLAKEVLSSGRSTSIMND